MDDLCELMLYVGQAAPKSLEGLQLEEIMIFMVVFMGSPGYVKNPFLRSRISEVTHSSHWFEAKGKIRLTMSFTWVIAPAAQSFHFCCSKSRFSFVELNLNLCKFHFHIAKVFLTESSWFLVHMPQACYNCVTWLPCLPAKVSQQGCGVPLWGCSRQVRDWKPWQQISATFGV